MQQWAADEALNPFQAALRASRELGVRLDVALDWELRDQGYKPQERDRRLVLTRIRAATAGAFV